MISFLCNICNHENSVESLNTETRSCAACGSNMRFRILMYLLSRELFGDGYPIPHFPRLCTITALGISDDLNYARRLESKFGYTNTYYDREPRLDLTASHPHLHGTYDFILTSDVLEHVAAPVERALDELYRLLKPGGFVCITVPGPANIEETHEHYPTLSAYRLASIGDKVVLLHRNTNGTVELSENPRFHGGLGETLEMRVFAQNDLARKLQSVGFSEVNFQSEDVARFGIRFSGCSALPLVARKGPFHLYPPAVRELVQEHFLQSATLGKHDAHVKHLDRRIDDLDLEVQHLGAHRDTLLEKIGRMEGRLRGAAQSRWVRLGNAFGVGPKLP